MINNVTSNDLRRSRTDNDQSALRVTLHHWLIRTVSRSLHYVRTKRHRDMIQTITETKIDFWNCETRIADTDPDGSVTNAYVVISFGPSLFSTSLLQNPPLPRPSHSPLTRSTRLPDTNFLTDLRTLSPIRVVCVGRSSRKRPDTTLTYQMTSDVYPCSDHWKNVDLQSTFVIFSICNFELNYEQVCWRQRVEMITCW